MRSFIKSPDDAVRRISDFKGLLCVDSADSNGLVSRVETSDRLRLRLRIVGEIIIAGYKKSSGPEIPVSSLCSTGGS